MSASSRRHLFLPELMLWEGQLRSELALAVGEDGRVEGVVPAEDARGATRLSGRVLLPGLVNAHSHAFQRLLRGRTEYVAEGRGSDDFWSWRELMYQAANALEPEDVYAVSRQAFVEMALAGITAVGEFHYLHRTADGAAYANPNELALQVIRAATDVGLRIALLRVGYARAGFNVAENPRQRRFIDPSVDVFIENVQSLQAQTRTDPRVSVAFAPHSVRAVPRPWLEAVASVPEARIHMHISEQPAEIEACTREHGRRPVELLDEVGLLSARFTGVHGIHLSADEISSLGEVGANVCACPSTERNLGDGIVPADRLLEAGVQLSLGSDSQANIDLLDEARQLESHLRLLRMRRAVLDPGGGRPGGLGQRLFDIASRGGARSLGLHDGGLVPGAPADFLTIDLRHPSLTGASTQTLLSSIVFGAPTAAVKDVYVAGKAVVQDGRHPLQEEAGLDFKQRVGRIFG